MFKTTMAMAMALASFLGIAGKEIPIADGKVAFTVDQMKILNDGFTEATIQEAINAMNKEIAGAPQIKQAQAQLDIALQNYKTAEEAAADKEKEKAPGATDEDPDLSAKIELLTSRAKSAEDALKLEIKNRDQLVSELMESADDDSPIDRILGKNARQMVKHSATHLFGSGSAFDAFEGRNWNKLAAGKTTSATDWSDSVNIQKLNGDSNLYVRENPNTIESLHRDSRGLPADWKRTFGVVDLISSGTIATAEITQGRQLNWAPKNNQDIQAEEGKIYPIKIDIEFVGYYLQEIEASWLAFMNKEGSQYDKMTFVRFLLQEIDKTARLEDRVATIKGVHVATPKSANKAGRFINRQNGILFLLWQARDITKKYRAFSLGLPTPANIVDYVDNALKSLPDDVRNMQGLSLNLSESWIRAYKRRSEQLYGTNNDYTGYPTNPKDYPNIKFQEIIDLDGSDFMFITFPKNIEILENIPKEKSLYRFGFDGKRNIFIIADYKMGIRPIHIGNKVKDGDPAAFKVQTIWSNDVPVFQSDFFAPVFDDTTGEIKATFNQLKVDDGFANDITAFSGMPAGTIVKIQGDTGLANAINVKDNAVFDLASDFNLKLGGTLTLRVMTDLTLKELKRTTAPETVPTAQVVEFTDGSLDSDNGSDFVFSGTSSITVDEIANGVPGQELKITGNADAATVTINNVVTIGVASAAVLAVATDSIEFVFIDGKWTEFNRNIA